jgi:hypothetical protein
VAVYTFVASSATAGLTTIVALTSDLASAKSQIASMDVMTVSGQNQFNDQDTNYDGIFPAISAAIPAPGPGTQTSPQKALFFVSDGVAHEYNPNACSEQTVSGGRCQEPINTALCTTLKNRGVLIAVLYTTYLPLPTNAWYKVTSLSSSRRNSSWSSISRSAALCRYCCKSPKLPGANFLSWFGAFHPKPLPTRGSFCFTRRRPSRSSPTARSSCASALVGRWRCAGIW